MFYRPIKIQSFDNQTSKFTRPLENVLAFSFASYTNEVRVQIICTEIKARNYSTVPPSVSLKKKTLEFILELEFQGYFIFSIKTL